MLASFGTFSSLAPLARFVSCVIMPIMRFFINAWRFHLLFAFWIHVYLRLGFSPALLLFFLPVLLQNECCYFFAYYILAFYILFTYPSHTIIYLLACILFCFFELNMQSLACLIFCNRFVDCFIVFSLTIIHICICCFFASSCRCHFVVFGGFSFLLFDFFCAPELLCP